jgi:3-oxoacyl-[acyl-carrier-protein] synthase II
MLQLTRANGQKRVVITGIGTLSPLGLSIEETWSNALNGKSGIDLITRFDASTFDVRFAGEVRNFNADTVIDKKDQKKMDLFIQYAIHCAHHAVQNSGLEINESNNQKIGVFLGTGIGGLPHIEDQHKKMLDKGPSRVSPFFIPSVITNLAPGWISMKHGTRGPNLTMTSACASGVHALGEAYNYIRFGLMEAMIAGGSEAVICGLTIAGFSNMKALSVNNENPQAASRPWDKNRDGFVLGEGASVFIVESLESALKRNAPIICEISGYGVSSDAYHITSPDPDGRGFVQCMSMALNDAQINPEDIGYINAHGTSTPTGDPLESNAIKSVFKDNAKSVWISSTKSMTGHLLGAAGALESAFCAKVIETQVVPPTINLVEASPECDLDYVPKTARHATREIKHVLNNSFGFGGTNSSLIFSKLKS